MQLVRVVSSYFFARLFFKIFYARENRKSERKKEKERKIGLEYFGKVFWREKRRIEEKIDEEEKGDGFRGGKIWGDKKIALKSGCNFCLEFSDD